MHVLCIKTTKHFVRILLPPDTSIILVFRHQHRCWTPTPSPLMEAPNTRGEKIGRFLTNKSMYLGNDVRYGHSCNGSWIGNHTQATERHAVCCWKWEYEDVLMQDWGSEGYQLWMVSDHQPSDASSSSTAVLNGEPSDTSASAACQCGSTCLLQLQFVRSVLSVNPCMVRSVTRFHFHW